MTTPTTIPGVRSQAGGGYPNVQPATATDLYIDKIVWVEPGNTGHPSGGSVYLDKNSWSGPESLNGRILAGTIDRKRDYSGNANDHRREEKNLRQKRRSREHTDRPSLRRGKSPGK